MPLNRRSALLGLATLPILAAATALATPALAAVAPAGAVIGNQAVAVYETPGGVEVTVSSNLVETVVNQVYQVNLEASWDTAAQPDTNTDAELGEREVALGGGIAIFPHTIENLGNGEDSFDLTTTYTTGTAFDAASIKIYADADANGVADNAVEITQTPLLAAGDVFGIVVQAQYLPTVGTGIANDPILVTTTSAGNVAVSDIVSNDITVINDAVIVTSKQISPGNGVPGEDLTITLTYTNSGNAAGIVRIKDPLPPELVYKDGFATWSDNSDASLNEDGTANTASGTGDNITLWAYGTGNAGGAIPGGINDEGAGSTEIIVFEVDDVPPGTSGTVTFDVTIAPGTAAGTYRNGVFSCNGTATPSCDPRDPGPEPAFVVDPVFNLTLADSQSGATPPATDTHPDPVANLGGTLQSSTDTGASQTDDIVEENGTGGNVGGTEWAEGSQVPFAFVITNDGSTTDTFNFSEKANTTAVAGAVFPSGTTFAFQSAAGVPLLDNDGDAQGLPDVTLAVGEAVEVHLVATLPAGETRLSTDTPWVHEVVATSAGNSALSNSSVALFSSAVVPNTVDIQNDGGVDGGGNVVASAGDAAAGANPDDDLDFGAGNDPFTVLTADPGQTVEFRLPIVNTSASSQSYELEFTNVAPTGTPTGATFTAGSLPAGFTAQILLDADGDPTAPTADQAVTTNTGVVPAGGTAYMIARITVPANATPQDVDIWFKATSSLGAAFDVKLDRLSVNPVVDVSIEPDQTAVGAPGGVLPLAHTITNLSNVGITDGAITYTSDFATFASDLYADTNNNGTLDAADITAGTVSSIAELLTRVNDGNGTLDPGESYIVFNRVQVSAVGLSGLTETATIEIASSLTDDATPTPASVTDGNTANNSVEDEVTIVSGIMTLVKEQAVDADCNGTADAPPGFGTVQIQADPGTCVLYRVTATNTGTANALSVEIRDETPVFTTYESTLASATLDGVAVAGQPAAANQPGQGATGAVVAAFGTVAPGSVAVMTFVVEIDGSQPNTTLVAPTPLQ